MNAVNTQTLDFRVLEPIAAKCGMSVEELCQQKPSYILQLIQERKLFLQRQIWAKDPVKWAEERLGLFLWSKQREILRAMVTHRKVAVQSCHEIGKSFIASLIVAWWIDTHELGQSFAITTAPTGPQVKAVLWREISRRHSEGKLGGRMNTTEWLIKMPSGKEELVAMGRKPSDYNPTAFQGLHAPALLFVIDEACGVPYSLWEAGDSLIANDDSKALAIGNPDDPTTEFKKICSPGSGWHVIQVGAFDTPNFTGEEVPTYLRKNLIGELYVEEKRKRLAPSWRWNADRSKVVPPGETEEEQREAMSTANPIWLSKVLGLFPENAVEGTLIPMTWVLAAQQREFPAAGVSRLGVDVGGGGDSSTIAERKGAHVRIRHEDHNPDTMQTCGNVVAWMKKTGATQANIDTIGIGHGVVDRGKELTKEPGSPVYGRSFVGINVGEAAIDSDNFVNRRAELWWHVRELFESGKIDIDAADDDLAGELVEIRFKRTSSGKIQIESKAEAAKRGVPSPNRADALMLSFAEDKPKKKGGTWGRKAA